MNAPLKHIALPAIAPAAIVALYFMPLSLIGCLNRGLVAVGIVLISLLGALATVGIGLHLRIRNHSSVWWLISTLILVLPCVLVFGPLG